MSPRIRSSSFGPQGTAGIIFPYFSTSPAVSKLVWAHSLLPEHAAKVRALLFGMKKSILRMLSGEAKLAQVAADAC